MKHFLNLMQHEREEARRFSDPIVSYHEGYAVILEEVEELWDEIRKKNPGEDALRYELVQIAAMCWRFAEDLGLLWDGNSRESLEVSDEGKHTEHESQ